MKIHTYIQKLRFFSLSWNTFLTFWTKINLLCDTLKKIFFSTNLAEQHQKTTFFLAPLEVHSSQFQRMCSMKFPEKYFKIWHICYFMFLFTKNPMLVFLFFIKWWQTWAGFSKSRFWFLILKNPGTQAGQVWVLKIPQKWQFFYEKSISLEHFIEHKYKIWEEWVLAPIKSSAHKFIKYFEIKLQYAQC